MPDELVVAVDDGCSRLTSGPATVALACVLAAAGGIAGAGLDGAVERVSAGCCSWKSSSHVCVGDQVDLDALHGEGAAGIGSSSSAGTGNPFFSTDTAGVLRALEIEAQVILKATNVDGIYTGDPRKDPSATFIPELTFQEAIVKNYAVMDANAFGLCKANQLPIIVFNINQPGAITRVLAGRPGRDHRPMSTIPELTKHARELMHKAVESTKREFSAIRSGKASTSLLDIVRVEAYGNPMPLNQVAMVAAPEPRLLTVQPFDKSLTQAIEKAIRDVRPRPQPGHPGQPDPGAAAGAVGGAPQGAGEGGPQAGGGGPHRRAARPHRDAVQDQEAREGLRGRQDAGREGRPEAHRRAHQADRRPDPLQRSRDHGSLTG